MTYIAPNTSLEFFPDLGLSLDLENTFYFASTAAKDAYFDSLQRLGAAQSCSYVRGSRGVVRVQIPIAQIYNAGYMRYRNASFEAKWFYAFVTEVEYINNETTEVSFVPDYIMTWMGAYTLGQCFVEREHTATDAIGEHLIDEDISTGDYVINQVETITPYTPYLVISSTVLRRAGTTDEFENFEGLLYDGYMLSGCAYLGYDMTNAAAMTEAKDMISTLIDKQKKDAIVSIRIVPGYAVPAVNDQTVGTPLGLQNGGTFGSPWNRSTIDGYTPANNKLFSYPYISYEVINGEGGAVEYRPELFANALHPSFIYRGVSFDNCEIILLPTGYKGSGLNQVYDEGIVMRSFPQASFDIDQYKAYLAQLTSGGGWLSIAADVAGEVMQAAAGNLAGAGAGLVDTLFGVLQDNIHYNSLPAAVEGTSNANIMSAMGQKSFIGYHKSIKAERARSIDNFFTMFGYRVNVVKTPSCNNRPHWTYVKTRGCIVHGSLPASDAVQIEAAFDNGIRFWINPAEIGNFSLNNAPGV